MAAVNVWIDQDLCTGDGICIEICPEVFTWGDDTDQQTAEFNAYLAYVKDDAGMKRMLDTVAVPEPLIPAVVDAAEDCPGECIFLEVSE